jgi:hypothetical protein
VGSTTYYRSPDDSALAVEVINNAGTLTATGGKCLIRSSRNYRLGKSGFIPISSTLMTSTWSWSAAFSNDQADRAACRVQHDGMDSTPGQQLVFSVLGEIVDFYSSSRAFLSGASQATRYVTVPTGAAWMRALPAIIGVLDCYRYGFACVCFAFGLVVRPDRIQSVPLAALPVITPEYLRTFQRSGTNLFNKNSRLQGVLHF